VDVNDKVFEDYVLNVFVSGSYHGSGSIVITLLYNVTVVISHIYEEGRVWFRVFFNSDVMVHI